MTVYAAADAVVFNGVVYVGLFNLQPWAADIIRCLFHSWITAKPKCFVPQAQGFSVALHFWVSKQPYS